MSRIRPKPASAELSIVKLRSDLRQQRQKETHARIGHVLSGVVDLIDDPVEGESEKRPPAE